MKIDMDAWLAEQMKAGKKKPLPILSFPGVQLIHRSVDEMVHSGSLQAKCMQAIAERYDTAAALTLMDLSVEAEAFGSPVYYSDNEVPTVTEAIVKTPEEADALSIPAVGTGRTGECIKAVEEALKKIDDRPILSGVIGPFSLAGRLLDVTEIMVLCYDEPELVKVVLDTCTTFIKKYIQAFKTAGAHGVVMAEPVAGLLSPALIAEFSNPYVQQIRESVEDKNFAFVYHNCGNTIPLLAEIAKMGCRAIHLGNSIDMKAALQELPSNVLVMGNISPADEFRNGTPASMALAVKKLWQQCSAYDNFLISSGCDIPPASPLENIDAFFQTIKEF